MKRLISILFFFALTTSSFAQSFTIDIDTPSIVAVGESFRIEFKMNHKPESFEAPSFEGFDLIAGPSISQSTNVSIINGSMNKISVYTYSYVVLATKKGNYNIGVAKAIYEDKEYKSKNIPIEVVAESSATSSQGSGQQTKQATTLAKDDVLLVMDISKKNLYKGEAVLATVKLLTRVQIAGLDGAKIPTFAGFWMQEINNKLGQNNETNRITYNNKIYDATVLKEYLLFPQQNGEITIDPMVLNATIRIADQNARGGNSIFESMFGGGGYYRDIRRTISSKPITIKIKPYPANIPASFNGAVGEFTMDSELSSDIIVANSASNLILDIKGNGNLQLISEPKLNLPTSFELYKIQAEESVRVTNTGVIGEKEYTYPFIARAKGSYTMPIVEFTYFNPNTAKFVTLKSKPFPISVSADTTSNSGGESKTIITGVTKEELKIIGSDIRYLMPETPELKKSNKFFIWSLSYNLTIVALIVIFILALFLLKRVIKESKDTVKIKSKKANKMALRQLKEAKTYLDKSESSSFYDAVLKSMWGYVADKLNIAKASLSRDNVGEKLTSKGVSEEDKDKFLSVISSCEEARYSPIASSMMSEVYNNAMDVITKFENKL